MPTDPSIANPTLKPGEGQGAIQNTTALARYGEILDKLRARNLKVMLVLYHHSMPKWAHKQGGWLNKDMPLLHSDFVRSVAASALGNKVDFWNTFNEPTVMVLLTYCAGTWPPGRKLSITGKVNCAFVPGGEYDVAMGAIEKAHHLAYGLIKEKFPLSKVGVAHNVGWHVSESFWDGLSAVVIQDKLNFPFIDHIQKELDFIGINYYGQEIHRGAGVAMQGPDKAEYSESGRCVFPEGIYLVLKEFHARYVKQNPKVEFMITENGISDRTDILRPAYLIEHLLAIRQAMDEGVKVTAYLHWTISDNWEWYIHNSYCPHFLFL